VTRTTYMEARDITRKGQVSEGEGWSRRQQRRNGGGASVCVCGRGGGDMRVNFFSRSAGFRMKSWSCYAMVGMIFGEVSGSAEYQTHCILCKQRDIVCVVPHLCGPKAKSSH
jgi:hypothetical protein